MAAAAFRGVFRFTALVAVCMAANGVIGLRASAAPALAANSSEPAVKPPAPYFHPGWKEEITESARRVAVADVTGDGKPRLILLIEKPQQRGLATLKIKKWDGSQFVAEFTGDVQANPYGLEVGKFAGKDKPAQIVTADALWSWDGKTYVRKPARKELSLFGTAKMKSGDERLILWETATQFKSYLVKADSDDWLTDRAESPSALDVEWEAMHSTPEFLRKMGIPSFLVAGGFLTLWDTNRASVPYLYYCRYVGDAGAAKTSFVGMRDATETGGTEAWTSPKIAGEVIDIAITDPRGSGRQGILVLSLGSASPGKPATLTYFTKV